MDLKQYTAPRRLRVKVMTLARMEYINTHSRVRHQARELGVRPEHRGEWIALLPQERKHAPKEGGGWLKWPRAERPVDARHAALFTLGTVGRGLWLDVLELRASIATRMPAGAFSRAYFGHRINKRTAA